MLRLLRIMIIGLFMTSCSIEENLKEGTFLIYEQGNVVDTIYRYGSYQIEAAQGKALVAKLNWITNDSLIISGIESNPKDVDSLKFIVWHQKKSKNKYSLFGRPLNSKIEYSYEAVLEKVSHNIENLNYQSRLKKLNFIQSGK